MYVCGECAQRLVEIKVSSLTAGFVVGGATSLQVLIRASGPKLATALFNVPGVKIG
jgi:hypothetical protein